MITLYDDFRYYHYSDTGCRYETKLNNCRLTIDCSGPNYYWEVEDRSGYVVRYQTKYSHPELALSNLLKCDNPVAVRALRAVLGDKYKGLSKEWEK